MAATSFAFKAVADKAAHNVPCPERNGRMHTLIVENEHIDAPSTCNGSFEHRSIAAKRRLRHQRHRTWDERNIYGAECRDGLRLAVFENLKIGLCEAAHELSARVEHARGDLHVIDLGSKGRRRLRASWV